jgi:hypothetical protein
VKKKETFIFLKILTDQQIHLFYIARTKPLPRIRNDSENMILFVLVLVQLYFTSARGDAPVCSPNVGNCNSSPPACGLFLFYTHDDSYDSPNKWSLFTGHSLEPKASVGEPDIVLPMIDANKNEYSPWQDTSYAQSIIPDTFMPDHKYNLEYILGGVASLTRCSIESSNIEPFSKRVVNDGTTGAIHNMGFVTTTNLRAGDEILMDCDSDLDIFYLYENYESLHSNPDNRRQSVEWLEEHAVCVDQLTVGPPSTVAGQRGAFSKNFVSKGQVIISSPLIHFDRSQLEIVYQDHKQPEEQLLPNSREHGIEYKASKVIGHQVMMNYAYGHKDSNVMLLPIAPGVNYINHHDQPNAAIRWSTVFNDTKILRETLPLMELYDASAPLFVMDFVALRDILPGEEIHIDYGMEWARAWNSSMTGSSPSVSTLFRHEIGVPDGFYPSNWMNSSPKPVADFIANPLKPGYMAPIRWADTSKVVTPWAFRMGLDSRVRQVLLEYCEKMGIIKIMEHVTKEGNGLEPGNDMHLSIHGDDWFLQRPSDNWRSNLHWLSPGAAPAHEHYLQALTVAGFDEILTAVGQYLGMENIVIFHVTFIACSFSTKGFLHHDMNGTGGKMFNVIVPLILSDNGPELDIQDINYDEDMQGYRVGRYRYEYGKNTIPFLLLDHCRYDGSTSFLSSTDVAGMMGDGAVHGTSAVDYRSTKEMRLAATIYITEVNESNVDSISGQYTQAYPPKDRDLLLSWAGRHWKKDDASRRLPSPNHDHVLLRDIMATD